MLIIIIIATPMNMCVRSLIAMTILIEIAWRLPCYLFTFSYLLFYNCFIYCSFQTIYMNVLNLLQLISAFSRREKALILCKKIDIFLRFFEDKDCSCYDNIVPL